MLLEKAPVNKQFLQLGSTAMSHFSYIITKTNEAKSKQRNFLGNNEAIITMTVENNSGHATECNILKMNGPTTATHLRNEIILYSSNNKSRSHLYLSRNEATESAEQKQEKNKILSVKLQIGNRLNEKISC